MAAYRPQGRLRPPVTIVLSPEELAMLDAQAEARGLPRSRYVAQLAREEDRRLARRESR